GCSHYARCTRCKSTTSLKGGSNRFGGQGNTTWFARIDVLNCPNIKLSTDKVILITMFYAKEVGIEQCHSMLGNLIGE
uniref:Transposase n=1 Tax=Romanomermis culicivorax TaxID=13658 RepID=A0A915HKE8_ROMCU